MNPINEHEQSMNHISLNKKGRHVMPNYPLCRMHFGQYQASCTIMYFIIPMRRYKQSAVIIQPLGEPLL